MKHEKILDAVKTKEKTAEDIAHETKITLTQTKRLLLRLLAQGKIESLEKDGKLLWKIKEKNKTEERFKYL